MKREEIETKIKEIIIDLTGIYDEPIQMDVGLGDKYGFDSLDLTEIEIDIENNLKVEIDVGEVKEYMTGNDIVDMILGKVSNGRI